MVLAQQYAQSAKNGLMHYPLLKGKIRFSDIQSRILQTVRHPKGSDFTLSVQVGLYLGLRDDDQSFVLTLKVQKLVFIF